MFDFMTYLFKNERVKSETKLMVFMQKKMIIY